jgi:hypothetical protein
MLCYFLRMLNAPNCEDVVYTSVDINNTETILSQFFCLAFCIITHISISVTSSNETDTLQPCSNTHDTKSGSRRQLTSLRGETPFMPRQMRGYFDFKQLDFRTYVTICHNSVEAVYFSYS